MSDVLTLIDFPSPYKLEIFDGLNSTPVDISAGFVNNIYYSDVVINLTSNDYKGNFKLEYFPGRLLSMYSISNPHPIHRNLTGSIVLHFEPIILFRSIDV